MSSTLHFDRSKQKTSFMFHVFKILLFQWLSTLGLLSTSVLSQEQRCSVRGICGYRDQYLASPCPVNEPPGPISNASFVLLQEFCPELVEEYGNNLCCSHEQIDLLVENLVVPIAFFSRCPSCYHNFRQSFCHFTCSPYQRQFLNVTSTEWLPSEAWNPGSDLVESVKTTDFFMTRDYAEKTFDNCKFVVNSQTNGLVMELLCGNWGAYRCTAERWFEYIGSTSNGYAPFDVNYVFTDLPSNNTKMEEGEVISFHYDTYTCGEAAPGESGPCGCVDCPLSCPSFLLKWLGIATASDLPRK